MSVKPEGDGLQKRQDYERPTVTVLGTIAGLTAGAANPGADIVFSAAVSDRRLKIDLRPVQHIGVLTKLAELPLS